MWCYWKNIFIFTSMDIQNYIDISTAIVNTGGIGGILYGIISFLKKADIVDKFLQKKTF